MSVTIEKILNESDEKSRSDQIKKQTLSSKINEAIDNRPGAKEIYKLYQDGIKNTIDKENFLPKFLYNFITKKDNSGNNLVDDFLSGYTVYEDILEVAKSLRPGSYKEIINRLKRKLESENDSLPPLEKSTSDKEEKPKATRIKCDSLGELVSTIQAKHKLKRKPSFSSLSKCIQNNDLIAKQLADPQHRDKLEIILKGFKEEEIQKIFDIIEVGYKANEFAKSKKVNRDAYLDAPRRVSKDNTETPEQLYNYYSTQFSKMTPTIPSLIKRIEGKGQLDTIKKDEKLKDLIKNKYKNTRSANKQKLFDLIGIDSDPKSSAKEPQKQISDESKLNQQVTDYIDLIDTYIKKQNWSKAYKKIKELYYLVNTTSTHYESIQLAKRFLNKNTKLISEMSAKNIASNLYLTETEKVPVNFLELNKPKPLTESKIVKPSKKIVQKSLEQTITENLKQICLDLKFRNPNKALKRFNNIETAITLHKSLNESYNLKKYKKAMDAFRKTEYYEVLLEYKRTGVLREDFGLTAIAAGILAAFMALVSRLLNNTKEVVNSYRSEEEQYYRKLNEKNKRLIEKLKQQLNQKNGQQTEDEEDLSEESIESENQEITSKLVDEFNKTYNPLVQKIKSSKGNVNEIKRILNQIPRLFKWVKTKLNFGNINNESQLYTQLELFEKQAQKQISIEVGKFGLIKQLKQTYTKLKESALSKILSIFLLVGQPKGIIPSNLMYRDESLISIYGNEKIEIKPNIPLNNIQVPEPEVLTIENIFGFNDKAFEEVKQLSDNQNLTLQEFAKNMSDYVEKFNQAPVELISSESRESIQINDSDATIEYATYTLDDLASNFDIEDLSDLNYDEDDEPLPSEEDLPVEDNLELEPESEEEIQEIPDDVKSSLDQIKNILKNKPPKPTNLKTELRKSGLDVRNELVEYEKGIKSIVINNDIYLILSDEFKSNYPNNAVAIYTDENFNEYKVNLT